MLIKNHIFTYLCLFLIIGIATNYYCDGLHGWLWTLTSVCLMVCLLTYFFATAYFEFSILILMFLIGGLRLINSSVNQQYNPQQSDNKLIKLSVLEPIGESDHYKKHLAKLAFNSQTWQPTKHLVILYKSKKITQELVYGDNVWVSTKLTTPFGAKNPHQFNYQQYLKNKGINWMVFANNWVHVSGYQDSYQRRLMQIKQTINQQLVRQDYNQHSRALMNALLMGNKHELNYNQKESFAKAGVMHLLAISGLHVGILFSIVMLVLYPLTSLIGKKLKIIVALTIIWGFASFVNFSASVCRASLMLSLYYGTILLNRKSSIYHTLSLSAFLLLLAKPLFLFDVGFQLSYSAVFFIVWLYPIVTNYFPNRNRFFNYLRDLLGVSLVAQAGTLPLSVYYFHRFSGWFLLGNLLLIPSAYLIILMGLIAIGLAFAGIRIDWFTECYNLICDWVFGYTHWLSGMDLLIDSGVYLSVLQVLVLMAILVLVRYLFLQFSQRWLLVVLLLVMIFQTEKFMRIWGAINSKELVVFSTKNRLTIGLKTGLELSMFVSDTSNFNQEYQYSIKNYAIHNHINKTRLLLVDDSFEHQQFKKTKNMIVLPNKRVLINHQNTKTLYNQFDWIVLNKAKLDSCDTICSKIISNSNYYNPTKCGWNIKEKGAFRIPF